MYSNLCQTNDRYILLESLLNRIEGIDSETVNAIIALHHTVYKPQFENADGVASIAVNALLSGPALISCLAGITAKIAAAAGGVSIPIVGWVISIASLLWTAHDVYDMSKKAYAESKQIAREDEALKKAKETVEENVAKNPYAKYAVNAADRTTEILSTSGGTIFDKLSEVGRTTTRTQSESTTTLDDEDFEEKFGFTKDLQIVDGEKALAHSKQYFFLMNGMNEYGNKVIDKEAYKDYLDEFEEYWEQHRDFFPYLDEKAARAKMIPEFTRHFYNDTFMPEFKKRLTDAKGARDKNKTLDELAAEGRNEFGEIVDKEKYYATMGFRPDGRLTDMNKFSKAFVAKTGLDLSYNPVTPDGQRLLEQMLKDPSGEYMKYLPPAAFLMTEEDRKPFVEKAKDPKRRGESQFGRYGNAVVSSGAASRQAVANQTAENGQQVSQERQTQAATVKPGVRPARQAVSTQDITDAPDVDKSSGPWKLVFGKERLASIYGNSPERHRRLMRLGYIMNINDGKFYRMNDADKKVMPQVVYDELDEVSRKNAEARRQVKLRQGRLTTADMTPEEIAESNRRAGLPQEQ